MTHRVDESWRIVAPEWLRRRLGSADVKVIDARPQADYLAGHIPGALSLPLTQLLRDESPPAVAALLGSRGIHRDDEVVVYDGHRGTYAARLAWSMERVGHRKLRLLGVEFDAWQRLGFEVSTTPAKPRATTYDFEDVRAVLSDAEQVKTNLHRPEVRLVDTRSRLDYLDGRIPGALSLPWKTLGGGGKVLREVSELQLLFRARGLREDLEIITYCDSGVTAALAYYALKTAGFSRVRLYAGSFFEWLSLKLPLERLTGAFYRDLLNP